MSRKRKKGRTPRRSTISLTVPVVLVFIALTIAVGVATYLILGRSGGRGLSLKYEDIEVPRTRLQGKIKKIDAAIYRGLYENGSSDRDILFANVEPKYERGRFWEFTQIVVRCPDAPSAKRLQRVLRRGITDLGADVAIRSVAGAEGRILWDIDAQGFRTHQIIFEYDHRPPSALRQKRPKLAIIIDDLGYDPKMAQSFMSLGLPLSLSVLPSAPFTKRIVRAAHKGGYELILHLPMEPKNYPALEPGPGALLLSMEEERILEVLEDDLKRVPGVHGVNNHMGSNFTEDRDKMRVVLTALKQKGLFYVDSRTTSGSVGYSLGREIGLPVAKRNVFLDNEVDYQAIAIQMERLLGIARHEGSAVGIGHPHPETIKVLKAYASAITEGFEMIRVSELAAVGSGPPQ